MTYVMDNESDFYCDLLKFVSAVDAVKCLSTISGDAVYDSLCFGLWRELVNITYVHTRD